MNFENSGMFEAKDGSLVSFSYQITNNRLARVGYFTHGPHGSAKAETMIFVGDKRYRVEAD